MIKNGHILSARNQRSSKQFPGVAIWKLTLAWLLVVAVAPLQSVADEPIDDYKLAIGLYKQGRWPLAAETFTKFLKRAPNHSRVPSAQFYGGLSLRNSENFDAARKLLRAFAVKNGKSENLPFALFRIAECSYFLDDFATAEKEFQAYIGRFPDHELNEWALPWLAESQLRQKKANEAVASYHAAEKKFPNGRLANESQLNLARAHEQLKQYDEAAVIYKKLIATPDNKFVPQAVMNLAERYFVSQKFEQAAELYTSFETKYPQHALLNSVQLYHGYALFELKQFDDAQEQFSLLRDDRKYSLKSRYWVGLCHRSKKEWDQAEVVLSKVLQDAGKTSLAQPTLFYLADTQSKYGKPNEAITHYQRLVSGWPNSKYAPQGLFNATVTALNAKLLDDAEKLATQFQKQYSRHRLHSHVDVLRGRVALADGSPAKLKQAAQILTTVIEQTPAVKTNVEYAARIYLAESLRKQSQHERALETLDPLLAEIRKENKTALRFADGLAQGASSAFELKEYRRARELATRYVALDRNGEQFSASLVTLILSDAHLGNIENVNAGLKSLATRVDDKPLTIRTRHDVAEIYIANKKWENAQIQFKLLVEQGQGGAYYAAGLSGWGWSLYHQKELVTAAEKFGQLVKELPDAELAPEASFMQARCLHDANKIDQAIAVYQTTLAAYAPLKPSQESENSGPGYYAYRAGLQVARLLRSEERVQEADVAYEELLKKFPRPRQLDMLLDEWALLNYEAENFKRSDEIFRRLVADVPESGLVDNAMLSLAESDYLAGNLDSAQKSFSQLVAAKNSDDEVKEVATHHLAAIAIEKRNWKAVDTTAGQLISNFPQSKYVDEASFWRAEALLNLEQNSAAQTLLKQLVENVDRPTISEAAWRDRIWILSAEIYQREKDYENVEATVADLRKRFSESPLLYQADEVLGRSYKNRARVDEARVAFQRVIDSKQGSRTKTAAKAQFMIADMLLAHNKHQEAQTEYLKVYHLYEAPEWQAPALYQAAQCDEALKQVETALSSYDELIKKFPENEFSAKAKQRIKALR